jgi:hypothetical protein
VAYFTVGSNEEKWKAYLYAGIVIACALGEAIVHHPMFLGVMRAGMHLRIATSALIYRKVRFCYYFPECNVITLQCCLEIRFYSDAAALIALRLGQ